MQAQQKEMSEFYNEMSKFCKFAEENLGESDSAPVEDYTKSDNPYQARYGGEWKAKLKAVLLSHGFVSVADLVDHIVAESEAVMAGTMHQGDWVFYHDALSLMTAKKTIQYMEDKGVLKRWLLPMNGLLKDQGGLRNYWDRPPGDSPELMPLDNNLNQDIHAAVRIHTLLTRHLKKEDERKFSIATPKLGSSAYKRLWQPTVPDGEDPKNWGCPNSRRIVQDCQLWTEALKAIYDKKGCLTDFAKRRGKRELSKEEQEQREETRGGSRTRREIKEGRWLHPDARAAIDELHELEKQELLKDVQSTDEEDNDMELLDTSGQQSDFI